MKMKKLLAMAGAVFITLTVGYAQWIQQNSEMFALNGGLQNFKTRTSGAAAKTYITPTGNAQAWEFIKQYGNYYVMQPYGNLTTIPVCTLGMLVDDCANYQNTNMASYNITLNGALSSVEQSMINNYSSEGKIFTPSISDFDDGGTFGMTNALRLTTGVTMTPPSTLDDFYILSTGSVQGNIYGYHRVGGSITSAPGAINTSNFAIGYLGTTFSSSNYPNSTSSLGVRPIFLLDKNKIVYAVDPSGGTNNWTNVTNNGGDLKLRIEDPGISITFQNMENMEGRSSNQFEIGDQIKITYTTSGVKANVVNGLLQHSSGFYYREIGNANPGGPVVIDTNGLPPGTYTLSLVAEERTSDNYPVSASRLSSKTITLVNPHQLTYTQTPQSGASAGKDYEFSKNVNAGQTVGRVTANPLGVTPLTYTLESNGDNSYQNFEIDGLDSNSASSISPLNVKIKQNAPDLINGGLKAGTYKFCISAQDDNGYPATPSTSDQTKVCTSFQVEKTKPIITFDQDDQGITYISGSTTGTTSHSEHATHDNTDITSNDVAIEYSIVSGNSTILSSGLPFTSVNPGDTANLVFNANVNGSIVIQAKIAATDNYEQAITTKTITLQLGITANYVEDKTNITAGSNAAKPPASYTSANRIGHVDVGGGTAPFTYSLPSGQGNNGSFYIDTSGNVYVNTSVGSSGLTPGSYTIIVDVSDSTSPNRQSATVTKTITIGAASLTGVGWEDPDQSGQALPNNTYTITYDPANEPNNGGTFQTKLIETTSGALANTVITYSIDPDPNNVLSISGTSTVNATVKGASDTTTLNNVKIKAHISGGIYGTTGVDTDLIVNVNKYPQTIAFPDTSVLKLPVGGACVSVPADITSTYSKAGEVIRYTSSNTSANAPFTINANGEVCPTNNASDAGNATLTGTLRGDNNYETATTATDRVIQIYVPGNITVTGSITAGPTPSVTYIPDATLKQALNTTALPNGGTATRNTAVAQVNVSGSTFATSTNNGNANADASLFTVTPTGYITLNQDITANDIANHGTANQYYIQVDVTDNNNNTRTVDIIIVIEDAKADFYFIDPILGTKLSLTDTYGTTNVPVYQTTYVPNGTIDVKTNLSADYSEVTIAESGSIPVDEDVIDHNVVNHFNILNASDPSGIYGNGGDAYVKACMPAGNGYAAQCIYAKVVIDKAEQDQFAFVNSPRWLLGKTPATIQPTYNGKMSQGEVALSSSNNTIAQVLPLVSGQDQSFQTMGVVGTVTLTATSPEDRNYNMKQVTTILETTERPPTTLTLFVPGMTYGDTNVEARITTGYKNGVPAYFYVDDTNIITLSNQATNQRTSPPMTAIGDGQVIVKVCQIDQPFNPITDDCNAMGGDYGEQIIIVQKKALQLTYEDETIYVGEPFPNYRFVQPTSNAFAFTDSINDFPIPINTSAKTNGSVIQDTNTTGVYDITGSYGANELSGNALHYNVTIKNGKLTIKQDQAQNNWYHLEDQQGNIVSANDWHNQIIDVVIDQINANAGGGVYDQISDTNQFSNADKTRFTVTKEDDNLTDIYFRIDPNGSGTHKGAISEKLQEHVKIDMTKPNIISITGYPVNTSGLSNLLNEITLGHYFKPGVKIEIKSEDPKPANGRNAKVSEIKEVTYDVYELDANGVMVSGTPIVSDTGVPGTNHILSFQINDIGNYRVCAIARDNAGNESDEKCSDLNIKKIDVDVDGDGKPDFNDPDKDGCPDLNIKWKDPNDETKWIVINGDRDYDGIPDLNIDSDGDGVPDLNIDTDHDGKPDLNLVTLKKGDWKPKTCVLVNESAGIMEEYCTGTNVQAIINVDLDGDLIPDINIDTDGNMKADFNISLDGVNPYLNIGKTPDEWTPKKDYTYKKFTYDTMHDLEPLLNMGIIDDRYPSINVDTDGDGIPDINIDIDGDGIPDVDVDGDGDGIPDLNIDDDGDGIADEKVMEITEWKPGILVDGDVPYMTAELEYKEKSDDPQDEETNDKPDTEVGGSYYPGDNVGGALTGDSTNMQMYLTMSIVSLLSLLALRQKRTSK